MKSPRSVAYSILIYSGVRSSATLIIDEIINVLFQILGVSLIVLSSMSWSAYLCGYDFRHSSVTYMIYLIYYRAGQCHSEIDWRVLDGINGNVSVELKTPLETQAVYRTYIFSLTYLVLSILLVVTCILGLCESRTDKTEKKCIKSD